MNEPSLRPKRRSFGLQSEIWRSDLAFRLLRIFFIGALLIYAAIPVANALLPGRSIKDYQLWYQTGQHVLHGEAIYPARYQKFPFMYPPTAAVLLAPVSLLGQTGLIVALVLLNAVAWTASILLAVRLATGSWQRQHLLLYLIPSLVIAVYAWSNFHLGQPSLLLLALILGGFVALQEKCSVLAGALFALAASIKAFPFLVLLYLLYRRCWVASAALLLTLAFLLITLPAPFRGWPQARADLQRWTEGMLLKYDEKGVAQRPGRSNSWRNQSIFGVANRMLRPIDADEQVKPHKPIYANVADLNFQTVNALIVGTGLVLGLVYLAVMPRGTRRTRETDALEFALFVLLLLMFTPLSFGYLFASLLYPFTVAVQRWLAHPEGRRLLAFCVVAVLLLILTVPFQKMAQTYGNTFGATLILFVGLALELWEQKRLPAPAAA